MLWFGMVALKPIFLKSVKPYMQINNCPLHKCHFHLAFTHISLTRNYCVGIMLEPVICASEISGCVKMINTPHY